MINAEMLTMFFAAKGWRSFIELEKTRPGADCGSDHQLLIAKFRLTLKKVGKTTRLVRYNLNQSPINIYDSNIYQSRILSNL